EAFSVIHSLRAPTAGYRISGGRVAIFYVPDVVDIDRAQALHGIRMFVGDGASLTRPLVRRHGDELFGHTTVRAQLGWCHEAGVKRAIFTHCGSQIVGHERERLDLKLRAMGRETERRCAICPRRPGDCAAVNKWLSFRRKFPPRRDPNTWSP